MQTGLTPLMEAASASGISMINSFNMFRIQIIMLLPNQEKNQSLRFFINNVPHGFLSSLSFTLTNGIVWFLRRRRSGDRCSGHMWWWDMSCFPPWGQTAESSFYNSEKHQAPVKEKFKCASHFECRDETYTWWRRIHFLTRETKQTETTGSVYYITMKKKLTVLLTSMLIIYLFFFKFLYIS